MKATGACAWPGTSPALRRQPRSSVCTPERSNSSCRSPERAEEITQDAFLLQHSSLRSGETISSVRGWVFRLADAEASGGAHNAAELPPVPVHAVRLWVSVIAYHLGSQWLGLVLPKKIKNWSPTGWKQRLMKSGGRLVKHAGTTDCCWCDEGGCLAAW